MSRTIAVSEKTNLGENRPDAQFRRLAHELRNSLHAIRSGIAVFRTDSSMQDERLQSVQRLLEKECQHASNLLEELIDFARRSLPQDEP